MAQTARWMRIAKGSALPSALAAAQPTAADPILLWLREAGECAFALIAPLRLAPGRTWRWLAWGSMPAIATCRRFGLPAYLEGEAIWLHGRRAARLSAARVGECAVIASSFLARFPPRELEQAFRLRLEAQHGWQFDTAWPTGPEARTW